MGQTQCFGAVPMEKYIGTKIIRAIPMTRAAYNNYRGWTVPEDENPADEGYLVEYEDSPTKNTPNHDNYVSWSPKDVFDRAYRKTSGMSFGLAIEAMKKGWRVSRPGWGNVYLYIKNGIVCGGKDCPWVVGSSSMLSEDWFIVEEKDEK